MQLKVLAFAGIAALGAAQMALSQDVKGPAELPPPGYTGEQYVDSAGCVFLRAGVNGQVTWVARVDSQRRQLCGYPATNATRVVAAPAVAEPAPAPIPEARKPVPESQGGPIDTVASTTTPPRLTPAVQNPTKPAPAPVAAAVAAPAEPERVVATATPGCPANAVFGERRVLPDGRRALLCARDPVRLAAFVARMMTVPRDVPAPDQTQLAAPVDSGCPPMAAYGERRKLPDGRLALLCVDDPARLAAFVARMTTVPRVAPDPEVTRVATATAPLPTGSSDYASAGRLKCPANAPFAREVPLQGGGSTVRCTSDGGGFKTALATNPQAYVPVVPRGYSRAWTDDRLNPKRGSGTAEGQLAQDQVWTRDVPAKPVSGTVKRKKTTVVVVASNAPVQVSTSTSTAPKPTVAKATGQVRLYVQVGSFGVPANAEGARARLAGMGLPVAGGKAAIKGKPVQVVYAGPFGTTAQAQAALNAARRAGFGDAFIR